VAQTDRPPPTGRRKETVAMRKTGILNQDILNATASPGHTDHIVVCDAGLPIPLQAPDPRC